MRKRIVVYLLVICLLAGMTPVQALDSEAELLEELILPEDGTALPEEEPILPEEEPAPAADPEEAAEAAGEFPAAVTEEYTAMAAGTDVPWLTWTVSDGAVTITGGTGSLPAQLEIPAEIDGLPVTAIAEGAFAFSSVLEGVSIPASVTSIGERAFARCTGITAFIVDDANPVYETDDDGFVFTRENVALVLAPGAFHGTYSVPADVTAIRAEVFAGCGVTEIALPEGLLSIGENAFSGSGLGSITIPASVASIGKGAFGMCSGLTEIAVTAGNAAYTSAGGALYDASMTTLIQAPGGFSGTFEIPAGVTAVEAWAFAPTHGLTGIVLPESLTSIGESAFYLCSALTSVRIPAGCASLGTNAFEDCAALAEIHFAHGADDGLAIGTNAFLLNSSALNTLVYVADTAAVPAAVENYPWAAGGRSVTFLREGEAPPEDTTGLTWTAADGAVTITGYTDDLGANVRIPHRIDDLPVTAVAPEAFSGCSVMETLTLPEGLLSIGSAAFYRCGALTEAAVPASVTSIGEAAFGQCHSLTAITVAAGNSDYRSRDGVLYNADLTVLLQAPGALDGVFRVPDSVTGVADWAFSLCRELRSIILPAELASIGEYAFSYCYGLTKVRIPAAVATIGAYAFENCSNLTEIAFEHARTAPLSIGAGAFTVEPTDGGPLPTSVYVSGPESPNAAITGYAWAAGNRAVTFDDLANAEVSGETGGMLYRYSAAMGGLEITGYTEDLPAAVTVPDFIDGWPVLAIGEGAFAECGVLEQVSIPEGVSGLGSNAFTKCKNLVSVSLPGSLRSIGDWAFSEDYDLAEVNFPEGLESIGPRAFAWAWGLTEIDLPASLRILGEEAFLDCNNAGVIRFAHTASDELTIGTRAFNILNADLVRTIVAVPDVSAVHPAVASYPWEESLRQIHFTDTIPDAFSGEENGFSYTYDAFTEGVTVIAVAEGPFESVVIPDTLGGWPVTGLGDELFRDWQELRSVTLPESLRTIGDGAFRMCDALMTIDLPRSVEWIGDWAFVDCAALRSAALPAALRHLGSAAFMYCVALENVKLPVGLTRLDGDMFRGCSSLRTLVIPEGPTYIGPRAFLDSGIGAVQIPASVTRIDEEAFLNCASLISVGFSHGAGADLRIAPDAFSVQEEGGLVRTHIYVSNGRTLPETLAAFDWAACGRTADVHPLGWWTDAAQMAGLSYGFVNGEVCIYGTMPGLPAELFLPAQIGSCPVAAMRPEALAGIGAVRSIRVDPANTAFCDVDGVLFSKDRTTLLRYPAGRGDTACAVPDYVTAIGPYAFSGCVYLTSVTLPEGLVLIEDHAFARSGKLEGPLTFPASVRFIGAEAFLDCLALASLRFEQSADDQLVIESGAFDLRNTATTLHTVVFVPDASDAHSALTEYLWEQARRSVTFAEGGDLVQGVWNGIHYTYDWPTAGLRLTVCDALPEGTLTIPAEIDGYPVTVLGEGLFRNAAALTEVILPDSLRSVEAYAFSGCETLARVDLPADVTTLGLRAFEECKSLRSMALPAELKVVEEFTFYRCEALERLAVPFGLTEIGAAAFSHCYTLRSVTIPATVSHIGSRGFDQCTQLTDVCFLHRAEDRLVIEKNAFDYDHWGETLDTRVRVSAPAHPHSALQKYDWSGDRRAVTYLGGDESALTWTRSNGEITITGLTDPETTQILIPGTIEGLPVTTIAPEAFLCAPLETITLPDGLTTIGAGAFLGCDKLRSVTLPATVTELQDVAFSGCLALTEIRFLHEADADLTIAEWAFALDGGIDITDTTVYVPDRWEIHPAVSGHDWAFNRRNVTFRSLFVEDRESSTLGLIWKMTGHGLTITGYTDRLPADVVIPAEIGGVSVTAIGENAFLHSRHLRSIRIPDSVTYIGAYAFQDCPALESVLLPSGLRTIEYGTFLECRKLRSVTLPAGLAFIDTVAFAGCWSLEKIIIPRDVTEIAGWAFSDCYSMTDIRFLHAVSDELTIGSQAFDIANNGDVDTLVRVPDVSAIHPAITGYAWDTPNPETNPGYCRFVTYTSDATAGLLWREENGEIMITGYTDELPGWVIIPETINGKNVTAIAAGAFDRCGTIQQLTLPGSVKTVGERAFRNCSVLRSVSFDGEGLLEISAEAFTGCCRLGGPVLPGTLRSIGDRAFLRCTALTDLTIPAAVETVGAGAFEACAALTGLRFLQAAADPLALTPGAFLCADLTDTTIRVPDASKVHPALAAYDWAADSRIVSFVSMTPAKATAGLLWQAQGGTAVITGYTAGLPAALTIPAEIEGLRVTAVAEGAFRNCTVLKSVALPAGMTNIEEQAFMDCKNLKSVTLPGTLTAVGKDSFAWCIALTAVDIPASVGCLGENAFQDCLALTDIRFRHERSDALTIGENAFGLLNSDCDLPTTVSVADTDRIHPSIERYDWLGSTDEQHQSRIVTYTSVKDAAVAASTVKMTGAVSVYGGVTVTWQKAEYAESYEIFRKAGSAKKWTSVEIVSGTSWLDTNVKNNTKYAYTIRALRGTVQGLYDSKGKTVTYYAAPALAAPQNTASGEKLSWGKVGGASKYRVSRLEDDGSLTPVGVTTKTSLTDTGVVSGDEYTYTVQCLNKKGAPISGYDPDGVTGLFVAAPALPVLTVTEDGIALAWDAPEHADAYVIYRKAGSAKTWTAAGTADGTEWLDTDVKNNTKYTYTVQAVWNGVPSGYNTTGRSVKFYMPPVITELSATVSGVKVKWGKVGGVSKYRLFRIEDDGTLTMIGDTKKLTLTDKTAPSGTVCTYTLQCLNKKGAVLSDCDSEGAGMYYLAAPALPVLTNEADAVLVSWEPVGGAETYTVFRKAGSAKAWSVAAEGVPDPAYRDTDVSSGVKYTYRIQAVSGETLSPMQSKGRAVVFLAPPELTGAAAVSSGIKVTWQKVPGAKGYYVYRRTGDGDWAKVGTIKKGGTVSYTDKNAAIGTAYFYTVAAYNGKSVSERDPAGVAASRD